MYGCQKIVFKKWHVTHSVVHTLVDVRDPYSEGIYMYMYIWIPLGLRGDHTSNVANVHLH